MLYLTVPTVGPAALYEMVVGNFVAIWTASSSDCRTIAYEVGHLISALFPSKPKILIVQERGLGVGVLDLLVREVPGDGSCEVVSDRIFAERFKYLREQLELLKNPSHSPAPPKRTAVRRGGIYSSRSVDLPAVIGETCHYFHCEADSEKDLLAGLAQGLVSLLETDPHSDPLVLESARGVLRAVKAPPIEAAP